MRRTTTCCLLALPFVAGCHHAPPEDPPETIAVSVATVARAALSESMAVTGRLVPPAEEDATLSAQVPGRLIRLHVREGDAVRAGDVLASIDRQSLDESTRTAAAALEKARQDEQVRVEAAALTAQLLEKGIASREERDADRAALEATRAGRVEAEARLTQARRQGEWSELRAPFSGVVAAVMKHPGELVDGTAATAVLRLLGTSVEEVSADATASDLARLATGQPATVSLPGRDQPLAGTVSRVARAVDPATGVGELRVRLAARSGAPLLSTVSVSIVVARHPDALAVPLAALRRAEGGGEQVVRLEGGKAHVVEVRTGARSDRLVEIVEGLKGGESVVVDSPLGLAPDTPLRIRTPANAEAAR